MELRRTDLERARLEAVQRVLRGESPEKVIAEYGYARSCIYAWLNRHRNGGDDALVSRHSPGRPPSLSNEHYGQLLKALLMPPPNLGAWTPTDLLRLIRRRFEIAGGNVMAWRILRKMGIVPVGLQSPGLAAWRQAHPGNRDRKVFAIEERTTSVTTNNGGVSNYELLVGSSPGNRVHFQLYSETPTEEVFERFVYKLMLPSSSATLIIPACSPRYAWALKLALELSHGQNSVLPPDRRREQVVGEERDRLMNRKRYKQPLVIYRREG